ncbi:Ycf48-like protein [compost metagenome]
MMLPKLVSPLLAALLVLSLPLAAQAEFVDPLDVPARASELAQSRLLNGVTRAGARLVAVGQRGHVLYSDDEGKSWQQASVPVSVDLLAVQFPTPTHGWAVGHSGVVLVSVDGGRTWTRQLDGREVVRLLQHNYVDRPPAEFAGDADALATFQDSMRRLVADGPDKPFHDLWFDDEKTGYVVGPFNLILRTEDGGKSWQPLLERTENPQQLHFFGVRRVGGELYVVGEQGMVLKLSRTERRFLPMSVDYPGTLFGLAGAHDALLVYGLRGTAFRSGDQGASWTPVQTGTQAGLVGSLTLPDGDVRLLSQSGHVLASTDGGRSFTATQAQPQATSGGIALADGSVLLVGLHGVQSPRPAP